MLQVKKVNGQIVEFNKSKISRVLTSAGVSQVEAEGIASQVEAWAGSVAGGVVDAREIKQKVLSLVTPETAMKIRAFVKQRSN